MTTENFSLLAQHLDIEQAMAETVIKRDQIIDNKTVFPIIFDSYRRLNSQLKRPVMIFLHGGSWSAGSKSQFDDHALYFARLHDFFTLSVDYRLSGNAPFPAAIEDSKTVVRWLKTHAESLDIDADKIILVGTSAGANIAAIHLTGQGKERYTDPALYNQYDSTVHAAILFNGEYDIWDLLEHNSLVDGISRFINNSPTERPDLIDAISPLQHIHQHMPPTLLLHGDNDQFVSHQQSRDFAEKMIALGLYAEAQVIAGKTHNWFNDTIDFIPTIKRIETFLAGLDKC